MLVKAVHIRTYIAYGVYTIDDNEDICQVDY